MQVKTSSLFERSFENILSCGHNYYSQQTVKYLYSQYKQYRDLLQSQPYIGSVEPLLAAMDLEHRSIVIKPCFKIIYTVIEDVVYLVDIWDTRQEPQKLVSRIDW